MKTKTNIFRALAFATLMAISALTAMAQVPEGVNYQAVIRNGSGDLVTSGTVKMRFTINAGSATGTTVYQETENLTPNSYGLVTHAIGTGTTVTGSFQSIDWDAAAMYLKVEADPNGGTNYSNLGTDKLQSVPYALHAKTANSLSNPTWSVSGGNVYRSSGRVGVGNSNPDAKLTIGTPGQTWTDYGITSDSRIGVTNGASGRIAAIMNSTASGGEWLSYDYENGVFANTTILGKQVKLRSNLDNIDFYTGNDNLNLKLSIQENGQLSNYWTIRGYFSEPAFLPSSDNSGYLGRPDVRIHHVNANTYYGNNTSIQSLSDRSLKTNVQPLSQGMSSLMQLRPVSYDFIPEKLFPTKEAREKMIDKDIYGQMGLIAQEVEEVFPGLIRDVEKEDGTILKTVGYSGLIPVMVKAMQEQQQEIEALKAEVEKLSKR